MPFDVENIMMEPEMLVIKEYGVDNCDLTVDMLTEVFVVLYTYLKKGVKEPEEVYTFTTDFEQALKRYRLLPNGKAIIKRFLTDDDNLIKLGVEGTKPKVEMTDELNSAENTVTINEIMERFNPDEPMGIRCRELTEEEHNLLKSESENIKIFSDSVNDADVTE